MELGGATPINASSLNHIEDGIAACSVDYIVEHGTSSDGNWYYRKWNSGIAECYGIWLTTTFNSGWAKSGGAYKHIGSVDYPFTFKSVMYVGLTTDYGAWIADESLGSFDRNKTCAYQVGHTVGEPGVDKQHYIQAHVIGKWK